MPSRRQNLKKKRKRHLNDSAVTGLKESGSNSPVTDSYRIIDANLNRAKEGLRVCEDIARFHLKDARITKRLRGARHTLTTIIKASLLDPRLLLQERNARGDLGRRFSTKVKKRSFRQVFMANAQRVKESLRVLEELLKLFDCKTGQKMQRLRFDIYAIEKKSFQRFPSLLHT